MKFSITREQFLKPLQLVASVVERRQTLPVLSNILISLKKDELSLTGTDLEVEVVGKVTLSEAEDAQSGEITVPARKLMDICKSLPDRSQIRFAEEGGRMQIVSGKSRFTLSTLPASEFPNVEESSGGVEFRIKSSELKSLIDNTAFAMAHQDVRYYLNGMLWEASEGLLRTVATDGHRLAMSTKAMPFSVPEKIQAIIPRKGIMELSRILGGDEVEVTVTLGGNHVRISGDDFLFTSKLVDGAYPDYERVLPRQGTKTLVGEREAIRQAFSRAAILSNEKYRGVRLFLQDSTLRITANNPEQEEAEEELTVEFTAESDLEIGFNVGYLIDVLNVLKGENIKINFTDSNSSALVEDPESSDACYVIMPMRL